MDLKYILIFSTVFINIILWISYFNDNISVSDFGNIKSSFLQKYMLIFAALAYIANLLYVSIVVRKDNISDLNYKIIIACILFYYILQLFFIPLVRNALKTDYRIFVRLLLLICCIPILILSIISFQYDDLILKILSVFTLFHVFFNDALLYGYLF